MTKIKVNSEIGKLKTVMLHRPGDELLNLTPDLLEELLFDDIPALEVAQQEHDNFAQILKDNNVKILYLKDLIIETIESDNIIKEEFIKQYINEANIIHHNQSILFEYLSSLNVEELVSQSMSGITIDNLKEFNDMYKDEHLDTPLAIFPKPNLYFTRDPFSNVATNPCINHMYTKTRQRETIYGEFIFKYHPIYNTDQIIDNRMNSSSIEGGDILVISEEVIMIGVSLRTSLKAIQDFADTIFNKSDNKVKHILAIEIPIKRSFMHLDTVLTQIDVNAFLIHPEIIYNLKVYDFFQNDYKVSKKELSGSLEEILSNILMKHIELIYCGGDDMIASQREQWSDGANSLALGPKKLVVYKRNIVTNDLLKSHGYELFELEASNLGVGRGGPRCMSMPFEREDI